MDQQVLMRLLEAGKARKLELVLAYRARAYCHSISQPRSRGHHHLRQVKHRQSLTPLGQTGPLKPWLLAELQWHLEVLPIS